MQNIGWPMGWQTGRTHCRNHQPFGQRKWGKKCFGWIDFVDDVEVVQALLGAVEEWGRSKGMSAITGPLGFNDMDNEGMLVEGLDKLPTISNIYNYPYYPQHLETLWLPPRRRLAAIQSLTLRSPNARKDGTHQQTYC